MLDWWAVMRGHDVVIKEFVRVCNDSFDSDMIQARL